MNKGEIALKITNHESVESLIGFASSWLVDLGLVSHAGPTCALLMPDDPEEIDLHDQEQFNWFRASVVESLHVAGLTGVCVAAGPTDPAAEDVRRL